MTGESEGGRGSKPATAIEDRCTALVQRILVEL